VGRGRVSLLSILHAWRCKTWRTMMREPESCSEMALRLPDLNVQNLISTYIAQCRGARARVIIDKFRHLALQTC
jgi:hypothetical protein